MRFVTYNPRGTGRGMDAAVRKNYTTITDNDKCDREKQISVYPTDEHY